MSCDSSFCAVTHLSRSSDDSLLCPYEYLFCNCVCPLSNIFPDLVSPCKTFAPMVICHLHFLCCHKCPIVNLSGQVVAIVSNRDGNI